MLLNHISMALRSIVKRRLYSAINIVGFAVGLSVCVLIILFVSHETGFDKAVPDSERVYRLNWESNSTGARLLHSLILYHRGSPQLIPMTWKW